MNFDDMRSKVDRFAGKTIKEKKTIRDKEKKLLLTKIDHGTKTTWDIFSRDKDFKELRRTYDKVFAKKFNEGYRKYI